MISGSVEQKLVGKGGFQEMDQCAVAKPHCKAVYQISKISQVGSVLSTAMHEAMSGRPGGVYVDVPANVLFSHLKPKAKDQDQQILRDVRYISQDYFRFSADETRVSKAATMLLKARRPLVIVGKGAAYSRAEMELENFVNLTSMPCLASPMGKGLLPDSHLLSMGPVRSKAMKESDVVLVVGTRLNWQWEFGHSPKWSSNAKFIIIDSLQPRKRTKHEQRVGSIYLFGDAKNVLGQLTNSLYRKSYSKQRIEKWTQSLLLEKEKKVATLNKQLSLYTNPMSYHTVFGVISKAMDDQCCDNTTSTSKRPILVNEGANTMDIGRIAVPIEEPRSRLDAGTMGTMGVGLGYGIAAALVNPDRPVLLVLGDSAFGFSAMECEVIMRYHLKVIVVVLNNGGIYGEDRRPQKEKERAKGALESVGYGQDPPPTAFGATSSYELLMKAFGGRGSKCANPEEFKRELDRALAEMKPCLLNVMIDPKAGVESARMGFLNSKL
jgi:2-hydroxyacyl-CoA lyase 1